MTTTEKARRLVEDLLQYGLVNGLLDEHDIVYTRNHLLDLLELGAPDAAATDIPRELAPYPTSILEALLDYCAETKLMPENTLTCRDLWDTRIMGLLSPKPSAVIRKFSTLRDEKGIAAATDYFYDLCCRMDYIRVSRIARNLKWEYDSPYGALEVTINLTKPEKDPKEIAALKHAPQAGYPKCLLCPENVGYAGRINHPARQTLRTLPVSLKGETWYFQYSPYVYYNEHCIVFSGQHVPMKMSRSTFVRLFDFLAAYPHYFIGSNADLPIVGGSILNHDHFQGGRYVFPMEKAQGEYAVENHQYPEVEAFVVNWPMSVLRLRSSQSETLITLGDQILTAWRNYSDADAGVLATSQDDQGISIPHNTLTPIARKTASGAFELDLVFRNNRTNSQHPMGIYHPHGDLHHIKKENIGLIEVMGLFILPGRLQQELQDLSPYLTGAKSFDPDALKRADHPLAKHVPWLTGLLECHGTNLSQQQAQAVLQEAVGAKCQRVLEDAGVFKTDACGRAAFNRFLKSVGFTQ